MMMTINHFIKFHLILVTLLPLVVGESKNQVNHDNDGDGVMIGGRGGGHDGDGDINIGLSNSMEIERLEGNTQLIIRNLMDPNPVDPDHDGPLILSERLTKVTGTNFSDYMDPIPFAGPHVSLHLSKNDGSMASEGANIELMRKMLLKLFNKPRSNLGNVTHKELIRKKIFERMSRYTSETFCQEFEGPAPGPKWKGVNVIGIIPGRLHNEFNEGVIVVGAHYDTLENCPGVDDNGAGVMAMLETARLMSHRMGELNNTVIFVAFDMEEVGALGSIAFVNKYLIPKFLHTSKVRFIGAFIMDMILNYDPSTNAQILPRYIVKGAPEAASWVRRNNYMGDFVSVWTRQQVDWHLWYTFEQQFKKLTVYPANHKILVIDPPIGRRDIIFADVTYRNFLSSDHASFWYPKNPGYRETLNAVLITDMGPWRGLQRACYHDFCDNDMQITTYNLEFVKHIIDALIQTIMAFD